MNIKKERSQQLALKYIHLHVYRKKGDKEKERGKEGRRKKERESE